MIQDQGKRKTSALRQSPVPTDQYVYVDSVDPYGHDDSSGKDGLFETLSALLRHRLLLILILIGALALAHYYISTLRPLYTARAEVILEEKAAPIDLGEVLSNPIGADKELQTELKVIRARAIMRQVIERLDLLRDPEFNSTVAPEAPPFWQKWLLDQGIWPIELVSLYPFEVEFGKQPEPVVFRDDDVVMRGAIDRLQAKTRAGIERGTTIVWVSVEAWSANKAALLANEIADAYINERLQAKVDAQRFASRFLGDRVLELRQEVEQAEAAVQAFRSQNTIVDESDADVIRFEELKQRLEATRLLERDHERRLNTIETALAAEDGLREAAKVLGNARISSLLAEGRSDRLEVAVNRAVSRLRSDLAVTKRRGDALDASLADLETSLQREAANLVRLRQLEREAEASKLLFETFLARQKETAARQDLLTTDARVLTKAEPPYIASSPKKRGIYLRAGIGALLVALGLIYLLERSRNRYVDVEELEHGTGYTVLGAIPRHPKARRRGEVLRHVRARPGTSIAEAVRNLRTSVLLANVDDPPKVVMVTSSVPGEGKSLTTILLATVSAQMGKKTIVVDADLRRRTLHRTLRVKVAPGLISVLQGSATLDEAIKVDDKSGLHALTVENTKVSAADLLASEAFADLINTLRDRYDLILLDTPPVLPVTDARVLSQLSDTLIYVVKWNDTPKKIVRHGLASLSSIGAKIGGVVLAQVDRKKQKRYGYGYYGYGGYRYYRKAEKYYTD